LAIQCRGAGAYEKLLPLFDGDEQRTILYLRHVMGTVLKRPYEATFSTLSERDKPLDKIGKVCSKMKRLYGKGWDFDFHRRDPGTFEMNVSHCFFRATITAGSRCSRRTTRSRPTPTRSVSASSPTGSTARRHPPQEQHRARTQRRTLLSYPVVSVLV
jgi:hypothetical protein